MPSDELLERTLLKLAARVDVLEEEIEALKNDGVEGDNRRVLKVVHGGRDDG